MIRRPRFAERARVKVHFFVLGLNHKTAPVALRERLSFKAEDLAQALNALLDAPAIDEALIISTCNRVEVLGVGAGVEEGHAALLHFLASHHGLPTGELAAHVYKFNGAEALRHVFRVASSLEQR